MRGDVLYNPTVVDLFCGCGGMSWGLGQAGFHILLGIDNWMPALTTFQWNHPEAAALQADLEVLDPIEVKGQLGLAHGELDCLVGGPPCQGFSKNVPARVRFLEDPQNQLFKAFLRFVRCFYPKTVIMENVPPIYTAYGGVVRTQITEWLQAQGYEVQVKVLSALDYGVPQRRSRCIFLASRTGILPQFPPPRFTSPVPLFAQTPPPRSAWDAISDLPVLHNGEGHEPMAYAQAPQNDYQRQMRRQADVLYDHVARNLKPTQYQRVLSLKPGQGLKDLPLALRPKSGYSGAYGRLDFEAPAPTITRWVFHPGSGRFCHPREPRLITIREAARLQGFTDDFRFRGTYIEKSHQVGNAVPPLLMEALASQIKACCRTMGP